MKTRICASCPVEFIPTGKVGRHYSYCSSCKTARRRREWLENKQKIRANNRASYIKKTYGLDRSQYDALFNSQNGCCAICRSPQGKTNLAVDHNHTTGKIRGLLCRSCNTAIGHLREDIQILTNAVNYIEAHK